MSTTLIKGKLFLHIKYKLSQFLVLLALTNVQ